MTCEIHRDSVLSPRSATALLIAAFHALVVWVFASGLGRTALEQIYEPFHVTIEQDPTYRPPPPPIDPDLMPPEVQVVEPEILIAESVPAEHAITAPVAEPPPPVSP